jgi:hypothetical protein
MSAERGDPAIRLDVPDLHDPVRFADRDQRAVGRGAEGRTADPDVLDGQNLCPLRDVVDVQRRDGPQHRDRPNGSETVQENLK